MAKTKLASMSIDALLTLRGDIGKTLSHKAAQLKELLSRLGDEAGGYKKRGRARLGGGRSLSNTVTSPATRGQVEERSPSGCARN